MSALPIDSFLDEIRRLRLLNAKQLKEVSRGSAPLRDAKSLAVELVRRGWLSAFQASRLVQGKGADLVLGSYVLLDKLGEGGMGQVYKARHQGMNRLVALKVVRSELTADTEMIGRFYREMALTSQLAHPNLVQAYDAGPLGDTHFLTMEYVEGIDLDRLLEQVGPLPVAQAVDYIRQGALGLQCIHDHGLVHRDIKPSNLLRTPAGLIKILDLGLARLQEGGHGKEPTRLPDGKSITTLTLAGSVTLGTVDYLAPEQALDFHEVDIRADIYSLGCTFYHLLAGRPPFAEGTLAVKLMRHQQAEPPDLRQVRPEVPREVAAVVRRMMAKRPADRYQSPAEVAAALGGSAPPIRAKLRWLTAATLLVLLAGAILAFWPDGDPDNDESSRAEPMRNAMLQDLADNSWIKLGPFEGNDKGAWEVPWCYDPDRQRLVRVGGRVPDHSNEIWSYDVGTLQWTKILPFATDPSGPNHGWGNRPGYGSDRGVAYDRDRRCVWAYGYGYFRPGVKGGLWKGKDDLLVEDWDHVEGVPNLSSGRVAYDEHAGKLVCLGKDASSFGRTYIYDLNTGRMSAPGAADPTGALTGRVGMGEGAGFLYVPELKGCLLVGAMPNQSSRVVTWLFDCTTGKWRDLAPAGSLPIARRGLGMSYDRQNRVVVMVGGLAGRSGASPLVDTWVYDPVSNVWTEMKPSGGPRAGGGPNKDCQMLAYDEEHNVHVLGLVDHGQESGVWAYRFRR